MRPHRLRLGLLAALACRVALAQEAPPVEPPIPIDKVEHEEVRLVLIDVVVVDREDRTVPGLGRDDFEVITGGEIRAIDTLDVRCVDQPLDDPRAVRDPASRASEVAPVEGRKIALVFDYLHLEHQQRLAVLEQAEALFAAHREQDDEWLVVALTGSLRVEQHWTRDPQEVQKTLRRMTYDVTLWNGNFAHLNEDGFVEGLEALLTGLGELPGSKALVLFSGMLDVPVDSAFQRIAASAASARVGIYPVDAFGLEGPRAMPGATGPASAYGSDPKVSLARLAVETGGRYTENTNDFTLAIARAQRDRACIYTVGFYDASRLNRPRRVTVRMRPDGLRAIHPDMFIFRAPTYRREARLRAAFALPGSFDTGVVRAHVFPLRPEGDDRWEALLVTSFPVPLADSGGAAVVRDFGAVLTRRNATVHRFDRAVTLRPVDAEVTSTPQVTFVERVILAPGSYTLTAVMANPATAEPHAHRVELEIPAVPRGQLFVVPPVLGRAAGTDLVIRGETADKRASPRKKQQPSALPPTDQIGSEKSFQPLVVHQLDGPTDIVVLSSVCVVGSKDAPEATITRTLRAGASDETRDLPEVPLRVNEEPSSRAKIRCQALADLLPAAALRSGNYTFELVVRPDAADRDPLANGVARFGIAPSVAASATETRPSHR